MKDSHTSPAEKKRRKPTLARHEDKLENILKSAARLFSERGYETTSLDDIADAVQIHKATLYHYIASKEDILYQCLVRSMSNYDDVLKRTEDKSLPPLQRLREFFSVLIEAQNNDFGRCLSLVGRNPLSADTGERFRLFQRGLDTAIRNLIEEGVANGTIRPVSPRLATTMIFGAYNWVPRWYRPELSVSINDISETYLDIFIRGISA